MKETTIQNHVSVCVFTHSCQRLQHKSYRQRFVVRFNAFKRVHSHRAKGMLESKNRLRGQYSIVLGTLNCLFGVKLRKNESSEKRKKAVQSSHKKYSAVARRASKTQQKQHVRSIRLVEGIFLRFSKQSNSSCKKKQSSNVLSNKYTD